LARRVLVVGGGISGLTCAYYLQTSAPDLDVRVVESALRLGGNLGTENVGGFIFERGPNGFLDNSPQTLSLVNALGLQAELLPASSDAKRRYILRDGVLQALPSGPGEFVRSKILSLGGRVRVLSEPFRAPGTPSNDDSVATFARRRIGREAAEVLVDALVTGIYAGDPERLSLRSAFPKLAEAELRHGSLFRALRAKRRAARAVLAKSQISVSVGSGSVDGSSDAPATASVSPSHDGAPPDPSAGPMGSGGQLHSFRRGLVTIVEGLATALGERVALDRAVESVRSVAAARGVGEGLEVHYRGGGSERYDAVVLAIPAPRAATLFATHHGELARALEPFPYAAVVVLCLGYRREDVGHPLDGYGFLVPHIERRRALGMIWTSTLFPPHVPAGHVSLRVLVGGARDPEAAGFSADELQSLVDREFGGLLGIQGTPVARQVYRYPLGIPQYNVGHAERLAVLERARRHVRGLYLTGNAYRGVGINDCVREGHRLSAEILRTFGSLAPPPH
jgi:oxygen-dependent protoporphyrinogen oxidase